MALLALALVFLGTGVFGFPGDPKESDPCNQPCEAFFSIGGGGEEAGVGEPSPFYLLPMRIRTFRTTIENPWPGEPGNVFYPNDIILNEIKLTNNSPTYKMFEVSYRLEAAEGVFTPIEGSTLLNVDPWESQTTMDPFILPPDAPTGTYMITATAQEITTGAMKRTASVFITVLSGSSAFAMLSIDETGFFLLPLVGFAALFILKRQNAKTTIKRFKYK
ncbi:MAG: hypothetical protein HY392_03255 [Candidatus Diapherotrites archaeon]|nr:hypothetical protein [Candidatus Diapherotrites archaeon]